MDETLIGTLPSTPLTNQQRRIHKNLARAEKNLIAVLDLGPDAEPEKIQRAEALCSRWHQAWKKSCRG